MQLIVGAGAGDGVGAGAAKMGRPGAGAATRTAAPQPWFTSLLKVITKHFFKAQDFFAFRYNAFAHSSLLALHLHQCPSLLKSNNLVLHNLSWLHYRTTVLYLHPPPLLQKGTLFVISNPPCICNKVVYNIPCLICNIATVVYAYISHCFCIV